LHQEKTFRLSGRIYDSNNMESLPYSHVLINGIGGITDEHGNFNFESKIDTLFHLKVSYLGYQLFDTLLLPGVNYQIKLKSSYVNINEIIVKANMLFFSDQIGSQAGLMHFNHKIAQLIPGNGDNSVFNLLRLQPGILAAGEQSSEMIIWGSNAGHSQVNFDDITLFGLKNYNDNISTVNPYMAKDIRIHKGGYDATMGERVGGIVDITGIDGSKQKTGVNLNLNNMTMNVLLETPLGNKSSLVGAYRQTYYNLYSPDDIKINENSQQSHMENSIVAVPDYLFRDGNIKFSGYTNNGDSYHMSSFWGQDNFTYTVDQLYSNMNISQELTEKNRQYGANIHYSKLWKGKGSSKISIAYSNLQSFKHDIQNTKDMNMMNHMGDNMMHSEDLQTQNDISEFKAKLSGNIRLLTRHELNYGTGLIQNTTLLNEESISNTAINRVDNGSQIIAFVQDRYSPNNKISYTLGLRSDYSINLQKYFLQPRFNVSLKFIPGIQFNASWGIYNQFIVLGSVVDKYNNYRYLWRISNGVEYPVLAAQHFVFGGVFKKNDFTLSIESFYKETEGITRLIESSNTNTLYTGNSTAKGIDFFVKQEYDGNSIWVSYSLAQTLEWFPYFQDEIYRNALHDQRHEIKFAGIVDLMPFFISANYVYGSGFLQNSGIISSTNTNYPYSRLDIAGIYRFSLKKMKLEAGISILNVFNHENIKLTNITQIPTTDEQSTLNIYSEAIPFTPTIFLNISF